MKEKKKVFVSIPMKGVLDSIVAKRMNMIIDYMNRSSATDKIEYELLPTLNDTGKGTLANLGHSIELLGQADIVAFAPGWVGANGCNIEKEVCERYNIPYVIIYSYFLDMDEYNNS